MINSLNKHSPIAYQSNTAQGHHLVSLEVYLQRKRFILVVNKDLHCMEDRYCLSSVLVTKQQTYTLKIKLLFEKNQALFQREYSFKESIHSISSINQIPYPPFFPGPSPLPKLSLSPIGKNETYSVQKLGKSSVWKIYTF